MNKSIDKIIDHVKQSVEKADNNISNLPNSILNMEGMSGKKTRHLYNNLNNIQNINYLEVGTWKGSSFISSLYGNDINSLVIDNWSEFDGPKNEFFKNVETFCPNKKYNFIENDFFKVELSDIFKIYDSIDIYLYDGSHDYDSQKKAITYIKNCLSQYSIIIIDDFRKDTESWSNVSKGTYDGIKESGLNILYEIERESRQEYNGNDEYWNGFGLFVCEK